MSVVDWFSEDYGEAREKFLGACAGIGAGVTSFRNPGAGPEGQALFADVAWLGPENAERVLLTCSATHGVEGFCGSGAQIGTFRGGLAQDLPPGVALMAVHAINPFGFAHQRRVNEDNIDINRNFVDHGGEYPANPGYEEIHRWLVPDDWDGAARAEADRQIEAYIQRNGMAALQAAVSGGQYSHADGLFYGGRAPAWSNRVIGELAERFLRGRRRVAFIDYHTGLGPSGYGEIIFPEQPGTDQHRRARDWFGEVTCPAEGTSTSAVIQGYITQGLERLLPGTELTAVALEYGTLPVPDVLQAVRADNWLYLKGDLGTPQGREIKQQVRAAFYVETELWKRQVWDRAAEVTRKAMAGLG